MRRDSVVDNVLRLFPTVMLGLALIAGAAATITLASTSESTRYAAVGFLCAGFLCVVGIRALLRQRRFPDSVKAYGYEVPSTPDETLRLQRGIRANRLASAMASISSLFALAWSFTRSGASMLSVLLLVVSLGAIYIAIFETALERVIARSASRGY